MNNLRFATLVHLLVLLEKFPDSALSSAFMASSIHINAVVVRRELKVLRDAGWVTAVKGKAGGFKLNIQANQLNLGEVYQLMMTEQTLFKTNHPNPQCMVGRSINHHLSGIMTNVDQAIFNELSRVKLAEFSTLFTEE